MSEKFEVGQKVIVESRNNKKVDVVDKITPTGLISVGGLLYRSDGTQRTSDVWNISKIKVATNEDIEDLKKVFHKNQLVKQLQGLDYGKLSLEKLQELIDVLS